MRVYNLTNKSIIYRGRSIPPDGGHVEYGDVSFIPDRDLQLEEDGVLSFDKLPAGWVPASQRVTAPSIPVVQAELVAESKAPEASEEVEERPRKNALREQSKTR